MAFSVIPTLQGQAAIAAAIAGTAPLTLSSLVVGDGNGAAITPLETQTALYGPRATLGIQSAVRSGNQVTVTGIVDQNTGGFTIREFGLIDANGLLLFVGSTPETQKLTIAEGAFDELTIQAVIVVSETANIFINASPGSFATQDFVFQAIPPFATDQETIDGQLLTKMTHPHGVAAAIQAVVSPGRLLHIGSF
ncbi:hypothetical protein BHAOGJBA_1692 [Methylobacterium hispanicum]|uniref:Phage tail fibre protein N-terminal domain-containing protein n=1 Tax=Methylobacterium hispanicum TaxID=270350 RepID=A0AAV4ZJB0_9HYPH|nr:MULTISPECIES: phage tail protein [Methylobacterium]GJD88179.1 hypothetical protein BHAOGJBA_1692 [Methylobacterium hispanicum]